MSERVVPVDLDLHWNPNTPAAILASNDSGRTALALQPDTEDADEQNVVFLWQGTRFASMGSPNDEAAAGHRLYQKGLKQVHWLGQVENSDLVATLERQNRVHPYHDPTRFERLVHHVLPLKESTVEVVADSFTTLRLPGTTVEAAASALAL